MSMPWKENSVMDLKREFVRLVENEMFSISAAARAVGISRKTGHKFLARYRAEGEVGLLERSRSRKHLPYIIPEDLKAQLIALREAHPTWGARKLLGFIRRASAENQHLPAVSSVHALLHREGLVRARRRPRRHAYVPTGLSIAHAPNDVWCVDFKGWFRTRDGKRCDPLTVTDAKSRYCLGCHIVENPRFEDVKSVLRRLFRKYGLPKKLRSDNGPPFASSGLAGLSRLEVWLLKMGITCERIEPGKPQQNGSHERFHRTLKAETLKPVASTRSMQQRRFDEFVTEYNTVRPHEALNNAVPADIYKPSERISPRNLKDFTYPPHYLVRRVRSTGQIKWVGDLVFVSNSLIGERIGITQGEEEGHWSVYYGPRRVGLIDMKQLKIVN